MKKTFYITRHGQTLFNAQKKIQGACDSPLTEIGIKQAQIAGKHLRDLGIEFDDAYTSTSARAIDTLKIMTDIPFTTRKDLKEWEFGRLEGEGEHVNPKLPYRDFCVQYGGEDEFEFQDRIANAMMDIANTTEGNDILVVAHGAFLGQFYLKWEEYNKINRKGRIQNCSIFIYTFEDGKFILEDIVEHDFTSLGL